MKRIDYYGRSFTVSDAFAAALVEYLDSAVKAGKPLGEFFAMRCYTAAPTADSSAQVIDVTVQIVAGVPLLVYPADAAFAGLEEIEDDPVTLSALSRSGR